MQGRRPDVEPWTDEEGRPLGSWIEITVEEWREIIAAAGGLGALSVFSSLTDPEGVYGPRQVYTAWGRRESRSPLVDIRDYKNEDGTSESFVCRKFVAVDALVGKRNPMEDSR
jgi:hypothetical protein